MAVVYPWAVIIQFRSLLFADGINFNDLSHFNAQNKTFVMIGNGEKQLQAGEWDLWSLCNHGRLGVLVSHIWLHFGTFTPFSPFSSPYTLETKTQPPSAFVVWEILGFSVLAFGCETSQQGVFVFWISDYNSACQIAFCFMPMHAAISEGKDPLYWAPYDQLWQLKGYNELLLILSRSGQSTLETCNNFRTASWSLGLESKNELVKKISRVLRTDLLYF